MSNDKINPEVAALFECAAKQLSTVAWYCSLDEKKIKVCNPAISGWSIIEHVEHVTIINIAILKRVGTLLTEAPAASGGINEIGAKIFATGEIPRGLGKSPEFALPKTMSQTQLHSRAVEAFGMMEKLKSRLSEFEKSQSRSPHPVIGTLTALDWLKFMEIHTRHHLKIVREIHPEGS